MASLLQSPLLDSGRSLVGADALDDDAGLTTSLGSDVDQIVLMARIVYRMVLLLAACVYLVSALTGNHCGY